MYLILLAFMIWMHIIDDFYLQVRSTLNKLKQKAWWDEYAPDDKYKNDYIIALLIHAFSWSISIHIPFMVYELYKETFVDWILYSITLNALIHFVIDDLKCNKYKINLVVDQVLHFIQIAVTWFIMITCFVK